MGDIISRGLQQNVTYWAPAAPNKFGAVTFASPSVIKGHWEDVQELFRDKNGQEVVSKSKVLVASDVAVGGYLFLGSSAAADPHSLQAAYEIMAFNSVPNRKATRFARKAFL